MSKFCYFLHEVCDKSGKTYNRDTLYDLMCMVNAFFKENGKMYAFFDDAEFFILKNCLDNRMKDLSAQGLIAPRIQAKPITTEELAILWDKEILGDCSPVQLLEVKVDEPRVSNVTSDGKALTININVNITK